MPDRVPSDGGGKAREWTRCRIDLDLMSRGDVLPPRVVVIEKEWADRQLAEALDVMGRLLSTRDGLNWTAADRPLAAEDAARLLRKPGRLPDDS